MKHHVQVNFVLICVEGCTRELSLTVANLFIIFFSQSTEIGASGKNGPSVVLHVGLGREYEHASVTTQRLSMEDSVLVPASKLKPVRFAPVLQVSTQLTCAKNFPFHFT